MVRLYDVEDWRILRKVSFEWGAEGYEMVIGEIPDGQNRDGDDVFMAFREHIDIEVYEKIKSGKYVAKNIGDVLIVCDGGVRIHYQTGRPFTGIEYEIRENIGRDKLIETVDAIQEAKEEREQEKSRRAIKDEKKETERVLFGDVVPGVLFEVVPYGWRGTVLGETESGEVLIFLDKINKSIMVSKTKELRLSYRIGRPRKRESGAGWELYG